VRALNEAISCGRSGEAFRAAMGSRRNSTAELQGQTRGSPNKEWGIGSGRSGPERRKGRRRARAAGWIRSSNCGGGPRRQDNC
jgi:hypothetical protein